MAHNRVDVTVPMEEALDEAIKDQLDYGDSRAEWIREAIRERLAEDGVDLDEYAIDPETDGGQTVCAD